MSFEIGGELPFQSAIREAIKWMRERNPAIPTSALEGEAFEVGGGGVAPAQSIVLNFESGRVWAASLDDPDKTIAGRTWVTEITVGEQAGRVLFGARLINVTLRTDDPFVPSLPGVARQVVERLPSRADRTSLSERARRVNTSQELDDMIDLLDDESRRLPVVVIADKVSRPVFSQPNSLARRLAGAAHVIALGADAARGLIRRWGKPLSVYDGAARLYRPGFRSDRSDPYEHPLWIPRNGSTSGGRADLVVSRVLAESVTTARRDDYPRFNVIRQAAAAREIAARRATATDTDLSRLFEEENQRLTDELRKVRQEFDQWLDDSEVSRRELERRVAEIGAELARARAQNDHLRAALASGQPPKQREPLRDLREFGTWAEDNLSTNIWVAPKAVKETEKNGVFDNPVLLGEALFMLDDFYVSMRREPGPGRRLAYESRLSELNCSDQPCFSIRNQIKSFPQYSVTYNFERLWCDQHIKYGSGTDPRRFFRIYYHWHDADQVLLIGHMPTHLDNNLTN
ncbi:hypothetical protein [Inquilinus sp. Marseille-Q2685]|uniref:hypothetical protein n=1 Tax=Inquilinus sp. Marseille-Q2685 TaxID=2866581 RepID=UPI001CE4B647|nr:hypothetical protein [Inquilinus sp. Marseille-Q2685]